MSAFLHSSRMFRSSVKAALAGAAFYSIHSCRQSILLDAPSDETIAAVGRKAKSAAAAPVTLWKNVNDDLPRQLCAFVDASPSPFHAVENAKELLRTQGFVELHEDQTWDVRPGGRYFVNRQRDSGTSLAAFAVGTAWTPGGPFSIIGTHVDSPCLRLKPSSAQSKLGYLGLGVETYGGGLWHTWLDRDLGIAGRVLVRTGPDSVETRLVNLAEPLLRIPALAAHYREHNPLRIDLERHLIPLLGSVRADADWKKATFDPPEDRPGMPEGAKEEYDRQEEERSRKAFPDGRASRYWPIGVFDSTHPVVGARMAEQLGTVPSAVVSFDLCLYDLQPATVGGAHKEYVFAARLDNQMMTFCALVGFTNSLRAPHALIDDETVRMVALFDHEEIGSQGSGSAKSTFIPHILKRICTEAEENRHQSLLGSRAKPQGAAFERSMARSFFLSADMIHATHPAHSRFAEADHMCYPNRGLVISSTPRNALMHNTPGLYMMREIACRTTDLTADQRPPGLQLFVNPNDVSCGSTLGPLFGTTTGIRTMDVGNAQLSMHSAREMAGANDVANAVALLHGFYREYAFVDKNIKYN